MSTIHSSITPPSSNCTTTVATTATTTSVPQPSTSIAPGIAEHASFKNRLQEFTQRADIPIPKYATVNVNGPHQVPQFRSCVTVDGETYTSFNASTNKKAAEQDAAKVALEGIYKKIKDSISKKTIIHGFPPIFQDKVFCKSILHEFAAKMNMEMPKYDTVKLEALLPIFVTSVIFNGVKHVGDPAMNKKEAEQLAARNAILSTLVDSGIGMQLSEVVKSKANFFSIVHGNIHANEYSPVPSTTTTTQCPPVPSVQPNLEATLETSTIKGDGQGTSQTDCDTGNVVALSVLEQSLSNKGGLEGGDQAVNGPEVGTFSPAVPIPIESLISNAASGVVNPEPWTFSPAVPLPISFPLFEEQNPLNASACGRKRKNRKKKKANKKAKESDTAIQVPVSLNGGQM